MVSLYYRTMIKFRPIFAEFRNKMSACIHGEKSWDIRSRSFPVILYLANVVEQKHRFVIFDLDISVIWFLELGDLNTRDSVI